LKKFVCVMTLALLALLLVSGIALAQEKGAQPAGEAGQKQESSPLKAGILGLAAAIAVGLSALGSGWAQSKIGAAAAGALAEKPELTGSMIILEAIPETMIILGFVVAVLIIFILK
jgi:V/A-type H+-transporting ATPase subunit K